jgi:hypothetical protein
MTFKRKNYASRMPIVKVFRAVQSRDFLGDSQVNETTSRRRHAIRFFALDKPWPYLVIACYFLTMALVWVGNPLLPLEPLASDGWTWHHVPEIFGFLFFGIYLASLGYLPLENFSYLDSGTLVLVTVVCLGYAVVISYNLMFPIVLVIVFIPSFAGYFLTRFRNIRKTRKSPNNSVFSAVV